MSSSAPVPSVPPSSTPIARPPAPPAPENDETPATEFIDLPNNLPGSHE